MSIVFSYLTSFSGVGGIERYNKCFMKAISESSLFSKKTFISLNDTTCDVRYVNTDTTYFKGFNGRKFAFILHTFFKSIRADKIVLGHINLSIIYILVRIVNPKVQGVLIVHGIEVWRKLTKMQRSVLSSVQILTVSEYSAQTLVDRYSIPRERITVINNMIDPFLETSSTFEKPMHLIEKHNLVGKKILITVCRIKETEKDKGYDKVIEALPELLKKDPNIVYILIGRYDTFEKQRLDNLCTQLQVTQAVLFSNYVSDVELAEYYKLADVFVMPSKKEGFGIVFIEALLNGLFVIAGNQDGSVDALNKGELGKLINPDDKQELINTIEELFSNLLSHDSIAKKNIQDKTIKKFSFNSYKEQLVKYISIL